MTVIQIAHTEIRRFDSPEHEPYDRYVIKLHARAAALLQEHSDVVLFANYRISTVKADVGFNKKVTRALGSGERVLYTAERPAFLAKNRFGLPDSLPLSWKAFAAAMPHFQP
jgi:AAA domain